MVILGVVNVLPEANILPPDAFAYQFKVPLLARAPITTVPLPQVDPVLVLKIVGIGFTVAITALRALAAHPADELAST